MGIPLIGSAGCYDAVLAFELETPWTSHLTGSRASDAALDAAIESAGKAKRKVRLLALEPRACRDRSRVLWLEHPGAASFVEYSRREYDVMRPDLPVVLEQLAHHGTTDAAEVAVAEAQRDLLVCTHGARDACCGRLGYPLYRKLTRLAGREAERGVVAAGPLERQIAGSRGEGATHEQQGVAGGPSDGPAVRVWRCSHLGGHRFAPTLLDLPSGRMFGHLGEGDAAAIFQGGAPLLARLDSIYRGRCSLPEPAQIVERRLWKQAGPGFEDATLSWTVDAAGSGWAVSLAAERGQQAPLAVHARVTLADTESIATPSSCGRDPEPEAPWRIS